MPLWACWLVALAGSGVFAAVLFWMMPPPLRRGRPGASVVFAIILFLAWAGTSREACLSLFMGGVGLFVAALPLAWMGRLPADMPSARDRAVRSHPRYREIARRGRIAGIGIVVLEILVIIFSVRFFSGA